MLTNMVDDVISLAYRCAAAHLSTHYLSLRLLKGVHKRGVDLGERSDNIYLACLFSLIAHGNREHEIEQTELIASQRLPSVLQSLQGCK